MAEQEGSAPGRSWILMNIFADQMAASQRFSGWEAFAKELDINLNECLWPGDKINRIITRVGQNDHTFY